MTKITHRDISKEALNWFEQIVNECKQKTGIDLPIYTTDFRKDTHDLARIYGKKLDKGMNPLYVLVDTFTVQCCYENEVLKCGWNLSGDTLKGIICHELAHIKHFRHGNQHRQETSYLLGLCA